MLKKSLKNGSFVLGTWCDLPSPAVVNVLAKAGLDFVIIDMEHGPMDYRIAQNMVMAAECEGAEALVRVPCLDESEILRALDIGSAGVIVPHIESVEDRKKAVAYSKFTPVGKRGFNPYVRSGGYCKADREYFNKQNEKTILGLILEGVGALKNLEAIIDDPHIDLIYIGTYDLSAALGLAGDVGHPKVLKELEKATTKIIKAKKSAGCMIHSFSDLAKFKKLGIQFITYKVDSAIIYEAVAGIKREFTR
ncbi:MAG: aldolase/citrate lyase family protein [Candidatus Omnitrophota bacterium]|jgi:4-hydroxy-2-oxoheptanedioate aldolase